MMKNQVLTMMGIVALGAAGFVAANSTYGASNPQPSQRAVLVELFTSEGCSSCPPADKLLESLDRRGPGSDPDDPAVVVLSEHVDYWNHIGWADPYSSSKFSDRQRGYAERFHLDSVYTPQMVVDGAREFVGNDAREAHAAIAEASRREKGSLRIIPIAGSRQVRIEVDSLASGLQMHDADVVVAFASNDTTSHVLRGENGGRSLHHVAVVRSLSQIGTIHPGTPFSKDIALGTHTGNERVVAFVQEHGQGRILGVAMSQVPL